MRLMTYLMNPRTYSLLIFLSFTCLLSAQTSGIQPTSKSGQWYVYWGWNGSSYTKSDIQFEGQDHNFTLTDVVANDRQTMFTLKKYFHPEYFTTPQYNVRVGKYLKNNWDISIGIDHMKYVVQQGQSVSIDGIIDDDRTVFEGVYDNESIDISRGFLLFEHTDGLNYINLSLRKGIDILKPDQKIALQVLYGAGLGFYLPRTDITLLGRVRYDNFNLAGYGADFTGGLRVTFKKRLFIQSEIKLGYVHLGNVRTTIDKSTKATQQFGYFQHNVVFGGNMFLKKSKAE